MFKGLGCLGALALLSLASAANAQAPAATDPKPPLRVTVVEVVPQAHQLALALADVLADRKDIGTLVDLGQAKSWFAPCASDETDRCFTTVCRNHQIDLVLRAWAASANGKLSVSIDFVRPHEHGLQTFEETGVDAEDPQALLACAGRAVEKVLGKPPSLTPTTPPVVLAPPPPAPKPAATPNPSSAPAAATAPAVTELSHPSGLRVASYATAGVGVAGLVIGLVEALHVNSENSTIDANKAAALAGDPSARTEVANAYGSAESASMVSDVGFAVGGAAVAAGVVMFFLSPNEMPKTTASIAVVNGGPTLALSGRF